RPHVREAGVTHGPGDALVELPRPLALERAQLREQALEAGPANSGADQTAEVAAGSGTRTTLVRRGGARPELEHRPACTDSDWPRPVGDEGRVEQRPPAGGSEVPRESLRCVGSRFGERPPQDAVRTRPSEAQASSSASSGSPRPAVLAADGAFSRAESKGGSGSTS